MSKINWTGIPAIFAAIEAVVSSVVAIKENVQRLAPTRTALLKLFAGFALLIALAFGSWQLWQRFNSAPAVAAGPAAALQNVPTQIITPKQIVAYKPAAKAKLSLPEHVQASSAHVVLSATDLPKSKHARTVSAVLDTETGNVTNYVQDKPLPWFERSTSGSAGLYAGFKGLEPAVRAEFRQDLYSIKGVNVSAIASADRTLSGATDTFIGVGARYEW